MKKNRVINKFLIMLALPVLIAACDDETSPGGTGTDFETLASSYEEIDGTGTITIPFRNATASFVDNVEISFGGTAVEGEDFQLVGITTEGVQISVIDDNEFEPNETIKLKMSTPGNNVHTVTIVSNCGDTENPYLKYFVGTWSAIEKYGPDPGDWYGPYEVHFEQDDENPAKFHLDNFYDADRAAYLVFDVANGTVHFPDQQPTPDAGEPTLLTESTGTFVIDECDNATSLTISLNYDGGVWEYSFVKL